LARRLAPKFFVFACFQVETTAGKERKMLSIENSIRKDWNFNIQARLPLVYVVESKFEFISSFLFLGCGAHDKIEQKFKMLFGSIYQFSVF